MANTHVGITDDGDEIPAADDNCPSVENNGQSDFDGDGVGDMCDDTPGWEGPDEDGVVEGTSDGWPFEGFTAPVDNVPTVNAINAGQAVPMKFSVGGDRGLDIVAAGYPRTQRVDCGSLSGTVDPIEDTLPATTTAGLNFGNGQYTYVWKTPKSMAGTCQRFVLGLADGTEHTAIFKLK